MKNERDKKEKNEDDILKFLKSTKSYTINDIALDLKIEPKLVSYLVEELRDDGLVSLKDITRKQREYPNEYFVSILNKEVFLIDIDRGFKRINRKLKNSNPLNV